MFSPCEIGHSAIRIPKNWVPTQQPNLHMNFDTKDPPILTPQPHQSQVPPLALRICLPTITDRLCFDHDAIIDQENAQHILHIQICMFSYHHPLFCISTAYAGVHIYIRYQPPWYLSTRRFFQYAKPRICMLIPKKTWYQPYPTISALVSLM